MAELIVTLCVAAALAATLQGITGFGYGLLLVALLTSVRQRLGLSLPTIVLIANVTTLFCQAVIVHRLRGRTALRSVWPLLLGAGLTIPLGLWLLTEFGRQAWLLRVFGVFVTAAALWLLLAPRRPRAGDRPRRVLGLAAGLVTGLGTGLFNTGGPPAVLYTYSRPIALDSAKVTVQWIFIGTSLYRLALVALLLGAGVMAGQGRPDLRVLPAALLAAPVAMAGSACGLALAARVHPDGLRRAVFVLLVLFGLKAIVLP